MSCVMCLKAQVRQQLAVADIVFRQISALAAVYLVDVLAEVTLIVDLGLQLRLVEVLPQAKRVEDTGLTTNVTRAFGVEAHDRVVDIVAAAIEEGRSDAGERCGLRAATEAASTEAVSIDEWGVLSTAMASLLVDYLE